MSHLFPSIENQIGDDIYEEAGDDQKEIDYIEEEDGSSSGVDIGDEFDDYDSDGVNLRKEHQKGYQNMKTECRNSF